MMNVTPGNSGPMQRRCRKVDPDSRGFSLVELMISMTLGLILIAGMVTVFSGNQRSSALNTAMANLQENARFALDSMARDVRMSGFQGCGDLNRTALNIQANSSPTSNFRASATTGSRIESASTWSPAPPTGFSLPVNARVGTDALILMHGEANAYPLAQQMQAGSNPSPAGAIVAQGLMSHLKVNDLVVVADCDTADLFRATAVTPDSAASTTTIGHGASVNASANLTKAYGSALTLNSTIVTRFAASIYYIGDTGLTNETGGQVFSLYKQTLPFGDADNNPPAELVQGVESMRIAYGVRSADGLLRYVPITSNQFNPAEVESVQVGILLSSWEALAQDNDDKTYLLAGQAVAPATSTNTDGGTHAGDKLFRLTFNTTIKVRNRRNGAWE